MGVNSDDGFSVKSGQAPGDVFGRTLGEFEGGRGASDTLFSFYVPQPGVYPFRLLYEQGGGGANCEWFTVAPGGQRVLLNDASQGTNAVYAYRTAVRSPIYVSGVVPVNGALAVATNSDLTAFVMDGYPVQVASVQMYVNGWPATVTTTRNNGVTVAVAINRGSPLLLRPGTNTATIVYTDNAAPSHSYTNSWQFTAAGGAKGASFTTLNPLSVNSSVNFSATNSGFKVYPWHTSAAQPNDVAVWTEEQILGLMGTNYATSTNWPNSQSGQTEHATLGPQGWYFNYTNYINWDISGSDAQDWDFVAPSYPKQEFPGMIVGNYADESGFPTTDGNNFSMLVETWLNFPTAGVWQMGVSSDDGASVKSGQAPGDVFGQTLGEIEDGTTLFSFYVAQPGLYPFRMLYEQTDWGASCEWFAVTPAGKHVLINDASQGTNAVYAYLTATNSPAYVSGVIPVNGAIGVSANANVTACLVDGNPWQVASAQMWINGTRTTASTSRSNNLTTVFNTGSPFLLWPGTNNTVIIVYTDNAAPAHSYTNSWQFNTIPLLASQTAPNLYQSPGTLAVTCQIQYPADLAMYFLDWEPTLPLGWTLMTASSWGNPQASDNEIVFDGPFPNPLIFNYTVSVPANQTGPGQILGRALYFLSGMTNTAFAPVVPTPLAVNCTNPYVYFDANCAVSAPAGLVSWWPGELNAYDVVGTNNGTKENKKTFARR